MNFPFSVCYTNSLLIILLLKCYKHFFARIRNKHLVLNFFIGPCQQNIMIEMSQTWNQECKKFKKESHTFATFRQVLFNLSLTN
jgi:hypothetical protein